jgi:hypothetical protein
MAENTTQKGTEEKKINSSVAESGFVGAADKSNDSGQSGEDEEFATSSVAEFNRMVRSKKTNDLLKIVQMKAKSEIVEVMDFERTAGVQIGIKSGSYLKDGKFVNTNDIPGTVFFEYGKAKIKLPVPEAIAMCNDMLKKFANHRDYVNYCISFDEDIKAAKAPDRLKF